MAKLAFLGLGVMGAPMARHLAAAGHDLTVYNRTAEKADVWVKAYGGTSATTPALAAQGAEMVMACVGNDDDLRAVCLGPEWCLLNDGTGNDFRGPHDGICLGDP